MADEKLRYIVEFDVKSGVSQIKGLNNEVVATANSAKQLTSEIKNLQAGTDGKGGMQGLTTATGGASAAALELGRVVSDAPYGIRGMANNVSQLASNILFMSQQTDKATGATIGFGGAIKGIFTALKGPLGVLLAVQAVIAAFDYFAGSTRKAKDEVDEFSSSVDDLITKFNVLSSNIIFDSDLVKLIGANEAAKSVEILANEFSDFSKKYESLTEDEKAQSDIVKGLVDSYAELLSVRGKIEATSKRISELEEDGVEQGQIEAQKVFLAGLYERKFLLEQIFKVETDGNKKTLKEFKQGLLDLSSELEAFRNKEIANMDISEEERLRLEYEASRKSIENKRLEFKDKEDARLDARLKEIQDLKATEEEKEALIRDAYETYNDAQIKANQDMRSVMLQMDVAYYSELGALRREDTEEAKKQAEDLAISLGEGALEFIDFVNEKNIQKQTNELDRIEAERDANKALTEQKIANLQRELEVEGLTAAQIQDINNEISRAKNDQTLYEQQLDLRAAQTKIAIANQVANAVKAIAGEGSGIAKGVAVAQTIWNTKQAFMAALGSAPYGPWNIAQAAAVAAMGAMQVKQILATKAPYEKSGGAASSAAGGGAGGGTTFNPNFNIVGSSGANQLASTVAGQLGEPTRAYVVYGDITTAEELESNAVQSAGL